jgi:hypothetical protein
MFNVLPGGLAVLAARRLASTIFSTKVKSGSGFRRRK